MSALHGRRSFTVALGATFLISALPTESQAKRSLDRAHVMEMVSREALSMNVSLSLALAVAHVESNFNDRAQSPKGAIGVMQIMPATALGEYGISAEELWSPRTNIRVGLHFLARLIDGYDGRTDIALSHYNGGSAVRQDGRLRVIPATRCYVTKVKRLRHFYRERILRGLH